MLTVSQPNSIAVTIKIHLEILLLRNSLKPMSLFKDIWRSCWVFRCMQQIDDFHIEFELRVPTIACMFLVDCVF